MSAENWNLLLRGLQLTLWLSLASITTSLVAGTVVGVLRVSPIAPLRVFATGYVELFRNIPLLIVLFFVFLGLPKAGIKLDPVQSAIAGLSAYTTAFVAEVVRAGIQAIHYGQVEAARALGLSYLQTMWLILLPQVFRNIIPPLGTVFIALVKNTSIASAISVAEIMLQAETIEGRTFNPYSFLFAGLLYLVLTVPLSAVVNATEGRLRQRR